jgi:hypothetical protein
VAWSENIFTDVKSGCVCTECEFRRVCGSLIEDGCEFMECGFRIVGVGWLV